MGAPLGQAPYLNRKLLKDIWSWLIGTFVLLVLFLLRENIAIYILVLL